MLRVRRGKRADMTALHTMLHPHGSEAETGKPEARHWRRLAHDPSVDFYVAQHDQGLHGMILLNYVRSLRQHGWQAFLDMAVGQSAPSNAKNALLDFAKRRARKRSCVSLVWLPGPQAAVPPSVLVANGFRRSGEIWACDLVGSLPELCV